MRPYGIKLLQFEGYLLDSYCMVQTNLNSGEWEPDFWQPFATFEEVSEWLLSTLDNPLSVSGSWVDPELWASVQHYRSVDEPDPELWLFDYYDCDIPPGFALDVKNRWGGEADIGLCYDACYFLRRFPLPELNFSDNPPLVGKRIFYHISYHNLVLGTENLVSHEQFFIVLRAWLDDNIMPDGCRPLSSN